jgi:hypothetical protein
VRFCFRYPQDAFVTKLNSSGTAFVYSTYLGGSNASFANGVAVDSSGNAYVIGLTSGADFPTKDAFRGICGASNFNTCMGSAFVSKFSSSGGRGGRISGIAFLAVLVWASVGRGIFAAPVQYITGMGSTAVVVGDFNNDGKLDMAVLNSTGSNLTLEFGNHDGIFGNNGITYSNFNFFGGPSGLAVADFNNDGRLDFVSSDNNDNELDI